MCRAVFSFRVHWCKGGWGSMKQADEGGAEDTVRWKWRRRLWWYSEMSWLQAPALRSFGTGADHGGCRWINQSHVDTLRAVLWTDDLSQTFGPRLAQQLACNTTTHGLTQSSRNRTELPDIHIVYNTAGLHESCICFRNQFKIRWLYPAWCGSGVYFTSQNSCCISWFCVVWSSS